MEKPNKKVAEKGQMIGNIRSKIFAAGEPEETLTWHNVTLPSTIYFPLRKAVHVLAVNSRPGDKRASYGDLLQKVINWEELEKIQKLGETEKK